LTAVTLRVERRAWERLVARLAHVLSLATRFGQDVGVAILSYRSLALWILGYHEDALADIDHPLKDAREINQAATLMSRWVTQH
jgi:hypothetical protein